MVPKLDCPHVKCHVKLKNNYVVLNDVLKCGKGIMEGECQHYTTTSTHGGLRRRVSRKRLRSSDDTVENVEMNNGVIGRLKCEEDYNTGDNEQSPPSRSCPKGENWLCLDCGMLLCSRYANGHAKMHWEDTKEEEETSIRSVGGGVADNNADDAKKASSGSGEENHKADHASDDTKEAEKDTTATNNDADMSDAPVQDGAGHCIAVSLADLSVWCYECSAYLQHPSLDALTKQLESIKFGNNDDDDENNDEPNTTKENEEKNVTSGVVSGSKGDTAVASGDDVEKETNDDDDDGAMEEDTDAMNTDSAGKSETNSVNVKDRQCDDPSESNDDDDYQNDSDNEPRASLLSGQVGTAIRCYPHNGQDSDTNLRNSDDEGSSDSDNSNDVSEHQAAIISSLLHSERAAAIRAYNARHESFDPGDMSQCVPMMIPKPPSFPDEMADFLKSPLCKSIIVLAGAGMSVSSGIPDFRSAGVGLYDTLRPELLTASEMEQELIRDEPTLALDKGMFLRNPLPMLELKRSFILGTHESRWKATLAHRFVELLHSKLGKLTRLYTQNIDGLELQCRNLPKDKVVTVHGSMGRAACELCETEVDFDEFCGSIRSSIKDISGMDTEAPAESKPIYCEACNNPTVKPTIVLFRGSMPMEFHSRTAEDLPDCDLLIIMGTSLTVAPANSLVYRVPPTSLRMVMNNQRVGVRLGIDYSENSIRDVFAEGHSDEVCLDLAEKMGWLDDLALIIDEMPESSAQLIRERLAQRQED